MSEFREIYSFERSDVGLHNWREQPYSAWAFQNVSELLPCAVIAARPGVGSDDHMQLGELAAEPVTLETGNETISDFLIRSGTESFLVSKAGELVHAWHAPHATPMRPHILFSISKSITGLLAGILQDQGLLDPQKPVVHYLPETAASGYGDCPLQHVLDMRVSLDFVEDYLDKKGGFARYRRATGWNPPEPDQPVEGLAAFLCSLAKGDEPHGGKFNYLSPNTDLLGLVLERICNKTYADLMSELLWQPLGAATDATITLDGKGAPRAAGGISITARDLMRLGELVLNEGTAGGAQIVSQQWLDDMRNNGDAEAWNNGDFAAFMGPGRYRNKWYQLGPQGRHVAAIGIHGQWLYVDPPTKVVIVKMSSQAAPLDEVLESQCLNLFGQIARMI